MQPLLSGRAAIVTGGSRGIGRGIAESYARAGASVLITGRKEDSLRAAAEEIGNGVVFEVGHAASADDARRCVDAALERFGRLDILVNNAGTNPYYGATMKVDASRYDKTFDVNVKGPLLWAQVAWERAFERAPGVIINISSVGGVRTEFGTGVYNVTKAALIHLTSQLAGEVGPTRVVGIAPGLIRTDFSGYLVERHGEKFAKGLPLKRLGESEDVANLALFLASDQASWITGQTIVIDGGALVSQGNS